MLHLGKLLERRSPTILERYQLKELEICHWTSLVCDYPREFRESLSKIVEYAYPSERKFVLDDVLVGWLEEHPEYTESTLQSLVRSLRISKKVYSKRLAPFYCIITRMQRPSTQGWTQVIIRMLRFLLEHKHEEPLLFPLAEDLVSSASLPMAMNILEDTLTSENLVDILDYRGSNSWLCAAFIYSVYASQMFTPNALSKLLDRHRSFHGEACDQAFQFLFGKKGLDPLRLATYLVECSQQPGLIINTDFWDIFECLLSPYFMMASIRECQCLISYLSNQKDQHLFREHLRLILQQMPKTRREALLKES
jgi:hypothetical protein